MRPNTLTIAGLDPSGGAGLLADIKTFEQIGVQGYGVCSALTFQRADYMEGIRPIALADIIGQLEVLLATESFSYCKIGLVPDWDTLAGIIDFLTPHDIRIVLDPILASSSGYDIHQDTDELLPLLDNVFLITPNFHEMRQLAGGAVNSPKGRAIWQKTNIFLKGGHHPKRKGTDYLFTKEKALPFPPKQGDYFEKHGSGCILSAAMTAYLALGDSLELACFKAKAYTAQALASNESLLAEHSGINV